MPNSQLQPSNIMDSNKTERQHARTLARYLMKSFGREKAIKTCMDNQWTLALATIDSHLADHESH